MLPSTMPLRAFSLVMALAITTFPACLSNSDTPVPADSDSGVTPGTDGGSPAEASVGSPDATVADANEPGDATLPGDATQPDDADVADTAPVPPTITSFTVTPGIIPAGAARTVTLAWAVTGASALSISGIGPVTGTSTTTSISAATTFTLTATSASNGIQTATVSVTVAPSIYVDVTNGSDATPGDGTAAHPYQTIGKAGSVAIAGQTIYVAPGTYPLQVAAVNLANNVGIEALTYGTVTLGPATGSSYGLTFAGSGFVHGIAMSRAYVNVSAGTVTLDGVQFSNIPDSGTTGASGITLTATGHAVVTPGGLTSYIGAGVGSFATLIGSGQLEIHGGALNNGIANSFSGSALISAEATSQVLLDGVTVESAKMSAIASIGNPQVTLQNGTLIHACAGTGGSAWSLNINSGSPTYVIDNSTITASPGAGIYVNGGASPSLTLRNNAVVEKSVAGGIEFQGGAVGTTLVLNGARISNNGAYGIDLNSGTYNVTMRATQITGNTTDGLLGYLQPASVLDLGTATTAGGNTFSGNAVAATASSNVNFATSLTTADLVVNAVGNTWDPTANGADATGHFPAATAFAAPPSVTGKNVQLVQSGTSTSHLKVVAAP